VRSRHNDGLLVHLCVEIEQTLGLPVNNQRQASGLGGVLVVNGADREQAKVVVGLRGGGHGDDDACDFGVRPFPPLVLIDSLFYFGYLHL
jgi:hypothetical protein